MRTQIKNIVVAAAGVALLAACGGSQEAVSTTGDVPVEASAAATAAVPTEVPEEAEPEPTTVPATAEPEPAATETSVPDEPGAPERGLLPVGITALPGLYTHDFTDAEIWLDVPEYGTDVQLIVVVKNEWQVTVTLLDDERLPDESTPGFSIGLADSDATIESVVEAMRESDAGRFSFEATTGVFAGADATIVTRVSNLDEESEPSQTPIITLSTGAESTLSHLYVPDWMMESYIFERDSRVMVVSYEWSPSRAERQMVLAQAAPIIESIELQGMS